jgi:hypothetical protein
VQQCKNYSITASARASSAADKTRLIRFGRHAAKQRTVRGEGKPETFDFLGFTHFCTRSRKWGSFVIGRKTIKKRMRAKLKAIKMELRKARPDRRNRSLGAADAARASELPRRLGQSPEHVVVLQSGEVAMAQVAQAAEPESASLLEALHPHRGPLLPANQGATPAALSPFQRQDPREEPGALAALAGICAGGGEQSSFLPRPL